MNDCVGSIEEARCTHSSKCPTDNEHVGGCGCTTKDRAELENGEEGKECPLIIN